ncbi:MAG: hypothetical protein H0W50_00785 [Parachlamydiaceae bacterium]|nr:hypothetical protein [Parachlamydiaceae bacterium]
MNKTLLAKLTLTAALTAVTFLPIITLSAQQSGVYQDNRNYNANYGNYGDYGYPNQNYNYGGYGGYGGGYNDGYGGYGGGVVNPYPAPGSGPGMMDDSSALYHSYLEDNIDYGRYPARDSGPGMRDDSSALYHSYLEDNDY